MAFDIDIGYSARSGKPDINEDFCAAMLPERGQDGMGSIVTIADGVSIGGMGCKGILVRSRNWAIRAIT
ncbi:MAG: hypothetical protein LH479_05295 [Polaromonas sp.]|nr:hypothetical protein [Polaromonas sp.]